MLYYGWSGEWLDGTAGRVCLSYKYFNYLGGYDEKFYPTGYQDIDLLKRAESYLNRKTNKCVKYNSKQNKLAKRMKNDSLELVDKLGFYEYFNPSKKTSKIPNIHTQLISLS